MSCCATVRRMGRYAKGLMRPVIGLLVVFAASSATAQETVRHVEDAGTFTKYLTPGLLDSWIVEGAKGESIVAHVTTSEFDPVLQLVRVLDGEERQLLSVDDQGSESRFAIRLPAAGQYKINVHAFKYKGGGNYSLKLSRFQASPLVVGTRLVGTLDAKGNSYHYLDARADQILIPEIRGVTSPSWRVLGPKGRTLPGWSGTYRATQPGMHSLLISGPPSRRYEVVVHEAQQQPLANGTTRSKLAQRAMDVWSFEGQVGQFRMLEVSTQGQLEARLIHAPPAAENEQRIPTRGNRPAMQLLDVGSKQTHRRFAVVLGRDARFQLQLLAGTSADYELSMRDPAVPIASGPALQGKLPVGGANFYRFEAQAGQLMQAKVVSENFDPVVRLYNSHGEMIHQDDDGGGGMGSQISHMVIQPDHYWLQVGSLGNGGGGAYQVELRETKLREIKVGGRSDGTLHPRSTEYWSFAGKEGAAVLINVRSSASDPILRLYNPDGVLLGSDDNNGIETDSLLAVRLPQTGRYVIAIEAQRGAGDYRLRLIDGD